jgi:hypothetical protein
VVLSNCLTVRRRMFDGSHSHAGGSGGSHSHGSGGGGGGLSPIDIVICFAISCVLVGIDTTATNFGGWVFRITHGGYEPSKNGIFGQKSGLWGLMYGSVGWGVGWGILALGLFALARFTRKAWISVAGVIAAVLAVTSGLIIAMYVAHKLGVGSPW